MTLPAMNPMILLIQNVRLYKGDKLFIVSYLLDVSDGFPSSTYGIKFQSNPYALRARDHFQRTNPHMKNLKHTRDPPDSLVMYGTQYLSDHKNQNSNRIIKTSILYP